MEQRKNGFILFANDMSSITIGISRDGSLLPIEAVFLSVEAKTFKKSSIVSNFFGLASVEDEYCGISQFHSIANKSSHLELALFRDLEGMFNAAVLPIGETLRKYLRVNTDTIIRLVIEFMFYAGAASFNPESDCGRYINVQASCLAQGATGVSNRPAFRYDIGVKSCGGVEKTGGNRSNSARKVFPNDVEFVEHRLGITSVVDRILVFDEGMIVEDGSHQELMERDGLYAKMYKSQAQWYQDIHNVFIAS